jgi:hypothetical protein
MRGDTETINKTFPLNLYRQIQGMYRTNFGVIG